MFWDLFDDILGTLNPITRLTGWLQIAGRKGSRRRKQRYSRTDMVRVTIPRADKHQDAQSFDLITKHLEKHGCKNYVWTHDSQNFYISVPRNQYKWFLWLYNSGQLGMPATAWRDRRKSK